MKPALKIARTVSLAPLALLLQPLTASPAQADASSFAGRAGAVDGEERTTWCTPTLTPSTSGKEAAPARAESHLARVASDGSVEDGVSDAALAQRVRLTCSDAAGGSIAVTSPLSRDADGDHVSVACPPDKPLGSSVTCMLESSAPAWWVYKGTDCGEGLAAQFDQPVVGVDLLGQMTGGFYELPVRAPYVQPAARPLFNDTCGNGSAKRADLMRTCTSKAKPGGMVGGTDLGFSFLAGGKLQFGFGDSWPSEASVPTAGIRQRGSILYRSDDHDPSDGIAFSDYDRTPDNPELAMEVIESPHDGRGEISAINVAGFSVREGGHSYRFLWFSTIGDWKAPNTGETATVRFATLAWSIDGKVPFVRGDQQDKYDPPRWTGDTSFGAGTVWLDRESGWVYLFGVAPYFKDRPVHLARVRAQVASILDKNAYRYWDGSGWSENLQDASPIIPAGVSARPELSVAYSAYAGRWLMLLTPTLDKNGPLQLWQSPPLEHGAPWTPAGRWEKVATTGDVMPSTTSVPGLYAPYTSDHLLRDGGRELYFMLSQWERVDLGVFAQPYNVGLWKMALNRRARPGCVAD